MPFDPTTASGLVQWFDPSRTNSITSSGGLVSQMNELTGSGYHATAAGSAQPGLRPIGGRQALDFNGTSTVMAASTSLWSGPFTIYIVAQSDLADSSERRYLGLYEAVTNPSMGQYNSLWHMYDSSSLSAGAVDTKPHVFTGSFLGSASSNLRVDGITVGTGDCGSTGFGATVYYGADLPASYYWDGALGEVLIYQATHSAVTISLVENYLLSKWKYTGNARFSASGLSVGFPGDPGRSYDRG